jgi:hypothetical protein
VSPVSLAVPIVTSHGARRRRGRVKQVLSECPTRGRQRFPLGGSLAPSIGGVTSLPSYFPIRSPITVTIARGTLLFVDDSAAALIVLRLDVRDVEEAISPDREVDESSLDGGFDVDDLAFIDVPGVTLVTSPFNVELLENAVFNDCDTAFLWLEHVDQHFFLHAVSF